MSQIETIYAADQQLPAGALGEVSVLAKNLQTRFRFGHDADGLHNDLLVAHTFGDVSLAAGVYAVVNAEGLTSIAKQAVGHVRIVSARTFREKYLWHCLVWPHYQAGGTGSFPIYGYEARDSGGGTYVKGTDQSTVDIKLVNASGVLTDCPFSFAIYGIRA